MINTQDIKTYTQPEYIITETNAKYNAKLEMLCEESFCRYLEMYLNQRLGISLEKFEEIIKETAPEEFI